MQYFTKAIQDRIYKYKINFIKSLNDHIKPKICIFDISLDTSRQKFCKILICTKHVYKKLPFLTLHLKQNKNKFSDNFTV